MPNRFRLIISRKGVLGPNEVEFAKSPDGLDILVPHPDAIRIVRDEIFTTGGPASPAAVGTDTLALMKSENARVSFRNGSTTIGLATQTTDYFKNLGVNIVETGNADKAYTNTMIYINGSTPYTAAYLAKVMNVATGQIISQYTPGFKYRYYCGHRSGLGAEEPDGHKSNLNFLEISPQPKLWGISFYPFTVAQT